MACSINQSSSSSAPVTLRRNYDVFVSFRGTDTRHNFTDHLFGALQRKGILAFRDDTKLKKGESIAPELLLAIEGSQVFVVVFSKNYAYSTWCLRELEKILYCAQVSGKRVLPIFCDVDPSEVRHQKGSYAEAFQKHEERFQHDLEMVRRWRDALTQVANLSGWDIRDRPQHGEIEKIVEEIIDILGYNFSSLPNDLVGIHTPIEELEKLLHLDSVDDVRVVGISGMGGLGKTTLATVLCGRISHQFDACCFIDDISKIYRHDGPIGVQKQILCQTLGGEHLQICNLYTGTNLIQSRLRHVGALIILDNVDQVEQLENVAVSRQWLGAGSRMIIISRDAHILKEYGVDVVYKVPLLDRIASRQLFCRKAFKLDNIMSDYEKLAYDMLNYANGLPLAIKVLGSFLFGRDISEWRSALARLRESPNKDIMDVLRLSFDGLEKMEKEIFLDIACCFNFREEDYVKNVLNCCGFHPDIGLRVLIDKSLISILEGDFYINRSIKMQYLLQKLGEKIVQENSIIEPRKWSRLWLPEHFNNVMLENMGKNVEAIVLTGLWDYRFKILMVEALSKMSHLRLLILTNMTLPGTGSLNCLSNELRYVEWDRYPLMHLPSMFQPNQLVELILKDSNVKQLWEDKKYLPNLRTLDLRHAVNLIKILDFEDVPNLELLNLEGCVKLIHIDPSIGLLKKLVVLNLKDCKNLTSIPYNNIFGLKSLKDVNLSGCSKVFNNPVHLKKVDISERALYSQSTPSILKWIMLPFSFMFPRASKDSTIVGCLLPPLPNFSCLRQLDISYCCVSQIPNAIGCISWLERLNLAGNSFVTLPSLKELSRLVYLNLEHCKQLKYMPELPSPDVIGQDHHIFTYAPYWTITGLYIFNCPELVDRERSNRMALSWLKQFIQANQGSPASYYHLDIVIPGSEIPWWFNNWSVGNNSSISIEPSLIMHDNNFVGIACYAVFSLAPDDPVTTMTNVMGPFMKITFVNNNDKYNHGIMHDTTVNFDRDLITVKSNHMWLLYFPRDSFFEFLSFKDSDHIQMKFDAKNGPRLHIEVKKFGYHWVFKQDLQLMHCGNSLARKRKFLAIEDEKQPQPPLFV